MKFQSEKELYRTIGVNIKHHRTLAGLTQIQLSDKAEISISYLSKLEASGCDKSLSIAALNQIANALDVEITEFFKEEQKND